MELNDYRICSRVKASDYRRGGGGRSADRGYRIPIYPYTIHIYIHSYLSIYLYH